jgi:hypothetical protein
MFAALSIAACAGPARREHPIYWYDTAPPAGFPETVRTVTEDRASFEKDTERYIRLVRSAAGGGEVNVLALSGGGAGAAFGAGALAGLSTAGTRPNFHVVTGVSAGALTAPFAFLGPAWDGPLTESFSGQRSAKLVQFSLTGLLFGSSIFKGKPLADLVNHYATEEMLRAVAVEAAKGRLLLIATTDLDSERSVIWDMGAIALQGGPAALKLFRQVLIASASIPGLFPPVMIPVETSGTILEEMHVDGSTTASIFIAPEIASILQDIGDRKKRNPGFAPQQHAGRRPCHARSRHEKRHAHECHGHPRRLPVQWAARSQARTHARLVQLRRAMCRARRIVDHTGGTAATVLSGVADSAGFDPAVPRAEIAASFQLSLHFHDGGCGQHVRIEIGHDPERAADDEHGDEDAEGKREHVVGVVRPGTDMQEEHQVNPHLGDGEHGKPGRHARRP